jgi:excinuclease UvrABC ATPase subunit
MEEWVKCEECKGSGLIFMFNYDEDEERDCPLCEGRALSDRIIDSGDESTVVDELNLDASWISTCDYSSRKTAHVL